VIAASPARMSSSAKDCVDSEQAYARRRAACRGPRSLSTFLWGTAFDARIEDALDVLTLADLPPGVYRVRPLAVPEDRRGTGPACRIQGPGGNRIRPTPLTNPHSDARAPQSGTRVTVRTVCRRPASASFRAQPWPSNGQGVGNR
jgi:hypothetical protein